MKVLQAKVKRDNDKHWSDVGLVVFLKDDGKVSIKDARTGEFYQCFEPRKREDSTDAPQSENPAPKGNDFDDDIPF